MKKTRGSTWTYSRERIEFRQLEVGESVRTGLGWIGLERVGGTVLGFLFPLPVLIVFSCPMSSLSKSTGSDSEQEVRDEAFFALLRSSLSPDIIVMEILPYHSVQVFECSKETYRSLTRMDPYADFDGSLYLDDTPASASSFFGRFKLDAFRHIWFVFRSVSLVTRKAIHLRFRNALLQSVPKQIFLCAPKLVSLDLQGIFADIRLLPESTFSNLENFTFNLNFWICKCRRNGIELPFPGSVLSLSQCEFPSLRRIEIDSRGDIPSSWDVLQESDVPKILDTSGFVRLTPSVLTMDCPHSELISLALSSDVFASALRKIDYRTMLVIAKYPSMIVPSQISPELTHLHTLHIYEERFQFVSRLLELNRESLKNVSVSFSFYGDEWEYWECCFKSLTNLQRLKIGRTEVVGDWPSSLRRISAIHCVITSPFPSEMQHVELRPTKAYPPISEAARQPFFAQDLLCECSPSVVMIGLTKPSLDQRNQKYLINMPDVLSLKILHLKRCVVSPNDEEERQFDCLEELHLTNFTESPLLAREFLCHQVTLFPNLVSLKLRKVPGLFTKGRRTKDLRRHCSFPCLRCLEIDDTLSLDPLQLHGFNSTFPSLAHLKWTVAKQSPVANWAQFFVLALSKRESWFLQRPFLRKMPNFCRLEVNYKFHLLTPVIDWYRSEGGVVVHHNETFSFWKRRDDHEWENVNLRKLAELCAEKKVE